MTNLLSFLLLFLCFCQASATSTPKHGPEIIAETSRGRVLGEIVESSNFTAEVYESIPYAEEPSGDLRFEKPVPRLNWSTILDVRENTACPTYARDYQLIYVEDCLRLKVVVPLDEHGKRYSEKLPLLFWIHGGSYQVGGKKYYASSGVIKNIASRKIAFASIDYRLAFEGFLSNGDKDFPGNLALEDLLLGINFLRENADNFGFDANNIVVAGESAGGSLAGLMAISPRFKGLFHGVMMFSGSPSSAWAIRTKHTAANSRQLFERCNCTTTPGSQAIKECMKKAPVQCYRDIDEFEFDVKGKNNGGIYEGWRMATSWFTPVVDAHRGAESFLQEKPETLSKKHAHLPAIISNAAHELMHHTDQLLQQLEEGWMTVDDFFDAQVPERYNASAVVRMLIKERYQPKRTRERITVVRKLTQFTTDEWLADAQYEALDYAAKNLTVYSLINDVFDAPDGGEELFDSTTHGTDLFMLFENQGITERINFFERHMQLGAKFAGRLADIMEEFIRTKKLKDHPAFNRETRPLIKMSHHRIEHVNYDTESYYFWKMLLPTIARFNLQGKNIETAKAG